jgi:glycosyltransferase involved in cell wall biosynthesis
VGGLESVVTMLARGHTAMGHRVRVAALVDPAVCAYPFLDDLEAEGVETERIVIPARAYGKERAAVRALCDELTPDVVHTHGYRSDVVDSGVARAAGIPVVSTVHGFTGGGLRNRIYEWIQERAFRDFDAVVAVSEPIVERLARRGVARSRRTMRTLWPPQSMWYAPIRPRRASAPRPRAAGSSAISRRGPGSSATKLSTARSRSVGAAEGRGAPTTYTGEGR